MNWQILIISFCIFSVFGMIKGFIESKKGNAYGRAGIFNLLGAFVWGDAFIFGIFWTLVSLFVLYVSDFILFMLIVGVFWMVRSAGEMIYWFNQQFSKVQRCKPQDLWFYPFFKNDSVFFIYQIYWQCILVLSIILSLSFAKMWLF